MTCTSSDPPLAGLLRSLFVHLRIKRPSRSERGLRLFCVVDSSQFPSYSAAWNSNVTFRCVVLLSPSRKIRSIDLLSPRRVNSPVASTPLPVAPPVIFKLIFLELVSRDQVPLTKIVNSDITLISALPSLKSFMTTAVILNSSSPYLSRPLPFAWATIDSESRMDHAGAAARIIRTKSATKFRVTRIGSLPQVLKISLPLLVRRRYLRPVSFDRLLPARLERL